MFLRRYNALKAGQDPALSSRRPYDPKRDDVRALMEVMAAFAGQK